MKPNLSIAKFVYAIVLLNGIAAGANYIQPADVPWQTTLTGPPAPGSDTEKAEIATLLDWQNKRTATDVIRCKSEETANPFIFSGVIGDKFVEKDLPVTAKLLKDVQVDIKRIANLIKARWARKRPPYVDERIHPCVKIEENGSYPSAHAVRGVVWSKILSQIFPEKKTPLIARGLLMGKDRVIAGIHFPSDVDAGQKLGDLVAEKLLADPTFLRSLAEAKDECDKAGISK